MAVYAGSKMESIVVAIVQKYNKKPLKLIFDTNYRRHKDEL
jgi:hypothetical protein